MTNFYRVFLIIIFGVFLQSMSIYDISFENSKTGEEIKLSDYKDKVIMIVNTASLCGFSNQFNTMQELWDKYKDKDFVLIAVPTNDFGSQEPKSDSEIVSFCTINFGINFLITKKVTSKGKNIHPFFKQIKQDFSFIAGPYWNFYKYIYSKNGNPLAWFSPMTKPHSNRIKKIIEN